MGYNLHKLRIEYKVIAAAPERARDIAQVYIESWHTTYQGIVADATLASLNIETRTQQWFTRLADPQPRTYTFVAVSKTDRVLGFATGGPMRSEELQAEAELYAVYLYKEFQRKDIGTALFSEIARHLAEVGFSSVGVWVLELNPSRGFYEALGGERIAQKSMSLDGITLNEFGYCWPSLHALLQRLGS